MNSIGIKNDEKEYNVKIIHIFYNDGILERY